MSEQVEKRIKIRDFSEDAETIQVSLEIPKAMHNELETYVEKCLWPDFNEFVTSVLRDYMVEQENKDRAWQTHELAKTAIAEIQELKKKVLELEKRIK